MSDTPYKEMGRAAFSVNATLRKAYHFALAFSWRVLLSSPFRHSHPMAVSAAEKTAVAVPEATPEAAAAASPASELATAAVRVASSRPRSKSCFQTESWCCSEATAAAEAEADATSPESSPVGGVCPDTEAVATSSSIACPYVSPKGLKDARGSAAWAEAGASGGAGEGTSSGSAKMASTWEASRGREEETEHSGDSESDAAAAAAPCGAALTRHLNPPAGRGGARFRRIPEVSQGQPDSAVDGFAIRGRRRARADEGRRGWDNAGDEVEAKAERTQSLMA